MKADYIGYLAAVVWILIPFVYWATARDWHKTRVGRAFMWLALSTAALFLLLLTGGLFGDYPGRQLVRGAVFAGVLFAGVRLIVLFFQLQAEGTRALVELRRTQGAEALK